MSTRAAIAVARNQRAILVYRDDIGRPSEGFVVEPLRHLRVHAPVIVATRKLGDTGSATPTTLITPRLPLPQKLRVATYRLAGPSHRAVADLAALAPRLVHAHFGLDAVQALPLARRLGVPLITTFHGYDVLSDDRDLARSHRGRAYVSRRAELADDGALFIAVSDYLRGRLLQRGFPADRVVTLATGVDLDLFQPVAGSREGVLFVGRLVPTKGVHLLLDAVAALPEEQRPPITVVGDGPERARLLAQAKRLRLAVRFLGVLTHEDVVRAIDQAAVVCTPTESDALCLANIEAQAMRVPVVSFRVGGVAEGVVDGQTGLLADVGDVAGLSQHLSRLLGDEELRSRMGAAGRKHVQARFDQRKQVEKLEALYETVAP